MIATRSILRARPRLVLACVLAFGIETLQPAVQPLVHRHPAADAPHVHATAASAAPASRAVSRTRRPATTSQDRGGIITTPGSGGWHLHLLHPLQLASSSPPPTLEPTIVTHRADAPPPRAHAQAPVLARAARGPPSSSPHC